MIPSFWQDVHAITNCDLADFTLEQPETSQPQVSQFPELYAVPALLFVGLYAAGAYFGFVDLANDPETAFVSSCSF